MGLAERHAYRFGYLQSEHWQNLRIEKLTEADACCFFCGKRDLSNDVHHIHYPDNLFTTELKHLRVLCREHHDRMHELMVKYKDIFKSMPPAKNKMGRDFVIFRQAAVEIEREIRNAGGVTFSLKGRRLTPGEIKPPITVNKKRAFDQKINSCKTRLADIITDDATFFSTLPHAVKTRCLSAHRIVSEIYMLLQSPSEWAEQEHQKLLDSLGREAE